MNWNPVLNKFISIKEEAITRGIDLWAYDAEKETCLDYWVREIHSEKYSSLLHLLEVNEYNDLLLLRYANYADVVDESRDITMDNMWDLYNGFLRECRSVVIDKKNDCLILTPFRKFRNLNECEETSYENVQKRIEKAACVEFSNKLDGSMQSARFYKGNVVMAGSQALDPNQSWRLADGYRMLKEKEGYTAMLTSHPDKTFIFEYISQADAHVVNYDVEGLFLIGIRDVNTGEESSYWEVLTFAKEYDIPTTEVYDKTLDEVMGELDDKSSAEAEGFVINIDGFKVKVKYNDYVYMHHMIGKISSINVIIQQIAESPDTFDDWVAKLPEAYRRRAYKVANLIFEYQRKKNQEIDTYYDLAPKYDRKQFMIWTNYNVPSSLRGYVRNKYLNKPYNVLKKGNGGYFKLKEMGIENYKEIFENE